MNKFWKHGYEGITFHLTIRRKMCWKQGLTKNMCQISLGWIVFTVFLYDHTSSIFWYINQLQEEIKELKKHEKN